MKLMATDMDGTLLSNDHEISKENVEAIRKAQERGMIVVIATGRAFLSAQKPLSEAGLVLPIICMNGADIRTKEGESVYSVIIERDVFRETENILKASDIFFEIFTNKGLFINDKEKALFVLMDILKTANPDTNEVDLRRVAEERIRNEAVMYVEHYDKVLDDPDVVLYKVLAFSLDKENLKRITKQLQQIESLSVSSSAHDNIEITAKTAQKGIALEWFAKQHGVPPEETVAVGDNFNDVSMLERAGFSVAMGNAEPEVKQLSDWTTKTNREHGVAHAIEKLLQMKRIFD
jgi:Cof subfamily protein (haloacid dehalogenase superfamily)